MASATRQNYLERPADWDGEKGVPAEDRLAECSPLKSLLIASLLL